MHKLQLRIDKVTSSRKGMDIAFSSTVTKLRKHPHGSIIHIYDEHEFKQISDGLARYEQHIADMFLAYALHMYEGRSIKVLEGVTVSVYIKKSWWKRIRDLFR